MVRKLLLFLLYSFVFIGALCVFVPKESLYFAFEKQLKNYGVVISGEQLVAKPLTLELHHLEVSVQGVDGASVKEARVMLLGVYNTIEAYDIELSSMAQSMLPLTIKRLTLRYSLFDVFHLHMKAQGEFGVADATFNLQTRKLHLVLQPSQKMRSNYRNSLRMFTKEQNGEYCYDKTL
jgi:hypothetical protein